MSLPALPPFSTLSRCLRPRFGSFAVLSVGFLSAIILHASLFAAVVSESPQPGDAVSPQILALQKSAEEGSVEAAVALGRAYAEGKGIRPDLSEAERWLRQAKDGGSEEAAFPLGVLLLQTSDGGSDVERAAEGLQLLRDSAESDPDSSIRLGLLHVAGQFVKKDFSEAERYFRTAADLGSADGWFRLGWLFSGEAGFPDNAKPSIAKDCLEKAFSDGQTEAGRLLVKLLREGIRLPKDEARAFAIVKEAAGKENAEACYFLGELYEIGSGTEASPEKARESYEQAASLGSAKAMNKLGLLALGNSEGGEEARTDAMSWFEKAAETGFAPAHLNLALLLDASVEATPENAPRAVAHLVAAANAGSLEAQDRLGSWYRDGRHVSRDLMAASAWFRQAANAGSITAKINLAQILEANLRKVEDLRTALGLYGDAATAGHPVAHFHIARLLASGITGSIDLARAHAHLSAAVKGGFTAAEKSLSDLEARLSPEQKATSERIQETLTVPAAASASTPSARE